MKVENICYFCREIETGSLVRACQGHTHRIIMEQKVKQNIADLRAKGYPCSQATLLGIMRGVNAPIPDERILMAISSGLRGGIGSTHGEGTCGALTGAVVALGLMFPDDNRKAAALSKELFNGFQNEFGSVMCNRIVDENGRKRCNECCLKAGSLAAAVYERETSQD